MKFRWKLGLFGGVIGGVTFYFALPLLLGLAHLDRYSRGPSFWYEKGYYKKAFLFGWRIRARGGPTPIFQHYYNQPRHWGVDIPAAYSILLFDPLEQEAEFTLHTTEVNYGGFGLYTQEANVEIPADGWVKVEIFDADVCVYQETIANFDEATRTRRGIPGFSVSCWDQYARLLDKDQREVESARSEDLPKQVIWNLAFAPIQGPRVTDWPFTPGERYRIRLQVSSNMPKLIWLVRLHIEDDFRVSKFLSVP